MFTVSRFWPWFQYKSRWLKNLLSAGTAAWASAVSHFLVRKECHGWCRHNELPDFLEKLLPSAKNMLIDYVLYLAGHWQPEWLQVDTENGSVIIRKKTLSLTSLAAPHPLDSPLTFWGIAISNSKMRQSARIRKLTSSFSNNKAINCLAYATKVGKILENIIREHAFWMQNLKYSGFIPATYRKVWRLLFRSDRTFVDQSAVLSWIMHCVQTTFGSCALLLLFSERKFACRHLPWILLWPQMKRGSTSLYPAL